MLDNHDGTYTAYAVCRTLADRGLVWYDWTDHTWRPWPDYTSDLGELAGMLRTYASFPTTTIAVDLTVSNPRIMD